MSKVTAQRKADHIRVNLEEDVDSGLIAGFEGLRFEHNALPELNLDDINLSQDLLGKQLSAPLLISSMTGGTAEARQININLATAAQAMGIAMGLGSQRAAIEDPSLENTFNVRGVAPDVLLFANLGAVQLNYGYGADEAQRAIDMIEADALVLHLNALQEAVQPEGDTNFHSLLPKIEALVRAVSVPVIAKEVGWGISASVADRLVEAGIAAPPSSWIGESQPRKPYVRFVLPSRIFPSLPPEVYAADWISPSQLRWEHSWVVWQDLFCALQSSLPRRSAN
jgi:isopentenyl-diphosphate delta-isomerase